MAQPNNFDDFCWFVVTNYDFLILKKLNLTAPFKKKTLFTAPSTWPIRRFLVIFEVRIKPSCDHTLTAGPNLMCPSSWALNSDNFPFFWTLYCSSRTRVTAVWSSVNICWLKLLRRWSKCLPCKGNKAHWMASAWMSELSIGPRYNKSFWKGERVS